MSAFQSGENGVNVDDLIAQFNLGRVGVIGTATASSQAKSHLWEGLSDYGGYYNIYKLGQSFFYKHSQQSASNGFFGGMEIIYKEYIGNTWIEAPMVVSRPGYAIIVTPSEDAQAAETAQTVSVTYTATKSGGQATATGSFEFVYDAVPPTVDIAVQAPWTYWDADPADGGTQYTPEVWDDFEYSTITDGRRSRASVYFVTFTLTKRSYDFTSTDVTVENGHIHTNLGTIYFNQDASDPMKYTATVSVDDDLARDSPISVSIAAGKFTDTVGNANAEATSVAWTYDRLDAGLPLTIESDKVAETPNDGNRSSSAVHSVHTLTFTIGGVVTVDSPDAFGANDIQVLVDGQSVTGYVSNLSAGSTDLNALTTTYTATLTLPADTADNAVVKVQVPADSFSDDAGNPNTASAYQWINDTAAPTITGVTVKNGTKVVNNSGGYGNAGAYTVDFTLSDASVTETTTDATQFALAALELTNLTCTGGVSAVNGSTTNFTGTFTADGEGACEIKEKAGTFHDRAGNPNTGSATIASWTHDVTKPTIEVVPYGVGSSATSIVAGKDTNDAEITLEFKVSDANVGELTDIDLSPSDLNWGVGLQYGIDTWDSEPTTTTSATTTSATYVKTISLTSVANGSKTISIAADTFTDLAGNGNAETTLFSFTVDTQGPTVDVEPDSTTANTMNLEFVVDEPADNLENDAVSALVNFAPTMVTVSQGSILTDGPMDGWTDVVSAYKRFLTTWTPSPTASVYGTVTLNVGADQFTDEAGNPNSAATSKTCEFTALRPTISISAANSNVSNDAGKNYAEVPLTFTLSAETTNFGSGDVFVNGVWAELRNFNSETKTATLRIRAPDDNVTARVNAGGFTVNGNGNAVSNTLRLRYDPATPSTAIAAKDANDAVVEEYARTATSAVAYTLTTTRAPVARFGATLTGTARSDDGQAQATTIDKLAYASTAIAAAADTSADILAHAAVRQVYKEDGTTLASVTSKSGLSMAIGAEHFQVTVDADTDSRSWGDLRLYSASSKTFYGGMLRQYSGSTYQSTEQLEYHWVIQTNGIGAWREGRNPPTGGAFYLADESEPSATHVWGGAAWSTDGENVAPAAAGGYTIYPADATVALEVHEFSVATADWGQGEAAPDTGDNDAFALVETDANESIRATLEFHRTEGEGAQQRHYFRVEPGWAAFEASPSTAGCTLHPAKSFTTGDLDITAGGGEADGRVLWRLQVAEGAYTSRSGVDCAAATHSLVRDVNAENVDPAPSLSITDVVVRANETTITYVLNGLDDKVDTFTAELSAGLADKINTIATDDLAVAVADLADVQSGTMLADQFETKHSDLVELTEPEKQELEDRINAFGGETKATVTFRMPSNASGFSERVHTQKTNGTHTLTINAKSTGQLHASFAYQDSLGNSGEGNSISRFFPEVTRDSMGGTLRVFSNSRVVISDDGTDNLNQIKLK